MLTQDNRKITLPELRNVTIILWIIIWYIYDRKNTYRDTNVQITKRTGSKTEIVRKTHKKTPQTYTQTGLTTRYENAPKPYCNTTNRSIRYVFKDRKMQCPFKKLMTMVTKLYTPFISWYLDTSYIIKLY